MLDTIVSSLEQLLENGFDSLGIRMWYSPAYVDSIKLISIKNINSKWVAHVSDYKIYYNKNRNLIDSLSGVTRKKDPKSGWQYFDSRYSE